MTPGDMRASAGLEHFTAGMHHAFNETNRLLREAIKRNTPTQPAGQVNTGV